MIYSRVRHDVPTRTHVNIVSAAGGDVSAAAAAGAAVSITR